MPLTSEPSEIGQTMGSTPSARSWKFLLPCSRTILSAPGSFRFGVVSRMTAQEALRGESLPGPLPSAYWSTYVLSVAREHGLQELVLDFIKRKWRPMVHHGTTFEVFGPDGTIVAGGHFESLSAHWGSFSASHAWSAHPLFHLTERLGGVTALPEDQATVRFRP